MLPKKVVFNTLPTVKLSGEVIVGSKKKWLTVGAEGIECPQGIAVLVPGDTGTEVSVEDVAQALAVLTEKVEEVIVAQMHRFSDRVKSNQRTQL